MCLVLGVTKVCHDEIPIGWFEWRVLTARNSRTLLDDWIMEDVMRRSDFALHIQCTSSPPSVLVYVTLTVYQVCLTFPV